MDSCKTCGKPASQVNLKRCVACALVKYCCRECQKMDWKNHRPSCRAAAAAEAGHGAGVTPEKADASTKMSPPKGVDRGIIKPFTHLDNHTWLHDRSEQDVYRLLIDSYRLNVEDRYIFDNQVEPDSLRAGKTDGLVGFRRYLDRVQAVRKGALLPSWWSADKRKACETLGMDAAQWSSLRRATTKADIIDQYGDDKFPMQLRMFTEFVTGHSIGGTPGTAMRQAMMMMEGEGPQPNDDVFMSVLGMHAQRP